MPARSNHLPEQPGTEEINEDVTTDAKTPNIDTRTTEPVPIDVQEYEYDNPAEEGQNDEASRGAWSVSVMPMQEDAGFDATIESVQPAQQQDSTDHGHRPFESLPPQRFAEVSLDDVEPQQRISAPRLRDQHRPSLTPSMEEEVDLDADKYRRSAAQHTDQEEDSSEFERAGLDFVDVQLSAGEASRSIYAPGGAGLAASRSRTSLEIRSDSISSSAATFQRQNSSETTRKISLKFWRKQRDCFGNSEPGHFATTPKSSHDRSEKRSPREGRAVLPSDTGIQMIVADEAGELQYVSLAAEPDLSEERHKESSAMSAPQPPRLKANTNESWAAIDIKQRKVAENLVNCSAATSDCSSEVPQSPLGRSAGPLVSENVQKQDVRPEANGTGNLGPSTKTESLGGRILDAADRKLPNDSAGASQPTTSITGNVEASKAGRRPAGLSPISTASPSLAITASHSRRLSSSNGPSALERYTSRTRQSTLPPKAPKEDQRHLQDFEAMMRASQATEAKRAREEADRQMRREEELEASMRIWESEILRGDWRVARVKGSRLRKVWWQGAPPSLRGRAWQLAVGNGRMLPRNLFSTTRARVQEMQERGLWPPANPLATKADTSTGEDVIAVMSQDIERTLPSLKLFQEDSGVMYHDLKATLECLVLLRADQAEEVRREHQRTGDKIHQDPTTTKSLSRDAGVPRLYEPGLSLLVATLLLNLSDSDTLLCILNLIYSRPWLRSLYSMDATQLANASAFERVLNTLLADQQPKVYANLQSRGVDPSLYVREWVKTLFVPLLPFDAVCRLWDNILLEEEEGSDEMVFRTCLALVGLLSSRLHVPDGKELISILQGRNRAALSVWYRMIQSDGVLAGRGAVGSGRLASHGASPLTAASSSAQAIASLPPNSPLQQAIMGPNRVSGSQRRQTQPAAPDMQTNSQTKSNLTQADERTVENDSARSHDEDIDAEDSKTASNRGVPHDVDKPMETRHSGNSDDDGDSGDAIEAPSSWVPRDALFSIYFIGEDALFSTLEAQTDDGGDGGVEGSGVGVGSDISSKGIHGGSNSIASRPPAAGDGWWKESTLPRLINRELGG